MLYYAQLFPGVAPRSNGDLPAASITENLKSTADCKSGFTIPRQCSGFVYPHPAFRFDCGFKHTSQSSLPRTQ